MPIGESATAELAPIQKNLEVGTRIPILIRSKNGDSCKPLKIYERRGGRNVQVQVYGEVKEITENTVTLKISSLQCPIFDINTGIEINSNENQQEDFTPFKIDVSNYKIPASQTND